MCWWCYTAEVNVQTPLAEAHSPYVLENWWAERKPNWLAACPRIIPFPALCWEYGASMNLVSFLSRKLINYALSLEWSLPTCSFHGPRLMSTMTSCSYCTAPDGESKPFTACSSCSFSSCGRWCSSACQFILTWPKPWKGKSLSSVPWFCLPSHTCPTRTIPYSTPWRLGHCRTTSKMCTGTSGHETQTLTDRKEPSWGLGWWTVVPELSNVPGHLHGDLCQAGPHHRAAKHQRKCTVLCGEVCEHHHLGVHNTQQTSSLLPTSSTWTSPR